MSSIQSPSTSANVQPPDRDLQTPSSWFVVTQVKAHRVLYFTDDADYASPTEGDWYYVSHYQGALPSGMTLRNCWRWRFNGSAFTDAQVPAAKPPRELLLESNRKALRRILREKINAVRAPWMPKGTLGTVVRGEKLRQAEAYLAQADGDYGVLQGVAQARGLSLTDAAQLVVAKAADTMRVLAESEQVFERFAVAIRAAATQKALTELREQLLQDVYPALSATCRFPVANTVPVDLDRPLGPVHAAHEKARLRIGLQQRINRLRTTADTGYLGQAQLAERRLRAARSIPPAGTADESDLALLQDYAAARQLTLDAAARVLIDEAAHADRLLARTEVMRLTLLDCIASIRNLADVREADAAIQALDRTEANATDDPEGEAT